MVEEISMGGRGDLSFPSEETSRDALIRYQKVMSDTGRYEENRMVGR